MPRKTSTIVVRPVQHGETVASKTVLGTMHELNRHAPLVSRHSSRMLCHRAYTAVLRSGRDRTPPGGGGPQAMEAAPPRSQSFSAAAGAGACQYQYKYQYRYWQRGAERWAGRRLDDSDDVAVPPVPVRARGGGSGRGVRVGAEPVGVPRGPVLLLGDGLWAGRFGVLPADWAGGGWDYGYCETGEAARYVMSRFVTWSEPPIWRAWLTARSRYGTGVRDGAVCGQGPCARRR